MESTGQVVSRSRRPWRRAVVASTLVFGLAVSGLAVAPAILTGTCLRNSLLNGSLESRGITAHAEGASGGWIHPLSFQNVTLVDRQDRTILTLRELRTSMGLLGFLMNSTQLGEFTLVEPHVDLMLDDAPDSLLGSLKEAAAQGNSPARPIPELSFRIENAQMNLRVPGRRLPLLETESLSLEGRVTTDHEGHTHLIVEPFQLYDHAPLSERHSEQGLAMVAPVLSQSTQITGSVSVWIEGITIPLNASSDSSVLPDESLGLAAIDATEVDAVEVDAVEVDAVEVDAAEFDAAEFDAAKGVVEPRESPESDAPIRGRAEFHTLKARLKPIWAKRIARLTSQAAQVDLPTEIEIVRASEVRFTVDQNGVLHEGMTFLMPQVGSGLLVHSRGRVGLDERLNLTLSASANPTAATVPGISAQQSLQRSAGASAVSHLAAELLSRPVEVKVTGTVSEPVVAMPENYDLLTDLSRRLAPDQTGTEPPQVSQAVFELIQGVGQTVGGPQSAPPTPEENVSQTRRITGGILNLIRAIRTESETRPTVPPESPAARRARKKSR